VRLMHSSVAHFEPQPLQDQAAPDAGGPRGSRKDDVGINTIEAGAALRLILVD